MRVLFGLIAALSVFLPGSYAWADESEKCAAKITNTIVKQALLIFKAQQKICKGLDEGATATFDAMPAGDGNGDVDGAEMDDADFDFAKLTEKVNKTVDKVNATVAKGGADCDDHSPGFMTLPTASQADVEEAVAGSLDNLCS